MNKTVVVFISMLLGVFFGAFLGSWSIAYAAAFTLINVAGIFLFGKDPRMLEIYKNTKLSNVIGWSLVVVVALSIWGHPFAAPIYILGFITTLAFAMKVQQKC